MSKVRIVAVPQGQAPLWVRQQWVGIVLPILEGMKPAFEIGVMGGWPEYENEEGYLVTTYDAISILERERPDAAQWWKTWAITPVGRVCSGLSFARDVCEKVP